MKSKTSRKFELQFRSDEISVGDKKEADKQFATGIAFLSSFQGSVSFISPAYERGSPPPIENKSGNRWPLTFPFLTPKPIPL